MISTEAKGEQEKLQLSQRLEAPKVTHAFHWLCVKHLTRVGLGGVLGFVKNLDAQPDTS